MGKEMIISVNPVETRVAIVKDDQLYEYFVERHQEYALAGSIYKGRVTRVLPGMQSAFVDIGLERDAFLYVSDFFEDHEEYERIEEEEEEEKEEGQAAAVKAEPEEAEEQVPKTVAPAVITDQPQQTEATAQAVEVETVAKQPDEKEETPGEEVDRSLSEKELGTQLLEEGHQEELLEEPTVSASGAVEQTEETEQVELSTTAETPETGEELETEEVAERAQHQSRVESRRTSRGWRDRHSKGRGLPRSKYTRRGAPSGRPPVEPVVLPGERLAKYADRLPAEVQPHVETDQPGQLGHSVDEPALREASAPQDSTTGIHARVEGEVVGESHQKGESGVAGQKELRDEGELELQAEQLPGAEIVEKAAVPVEGAAGTAPATTPVDLEEEIHEKLSEEGLGSQVERPKEENLQGSAGQAASQPADQNREDENQAAAVASTKEKPVETETQPVEIGREATTRGPEASAAATESDTVTEPNPSRGAGEEDAPSKAKVGSQSSAGTELRQSRSNAGNEATGEEPGGKPSSRSASGDSQNSSQETKLEARHGSSHRGYYYRRLPRRPRRRRRHQTTHTSSPAQVPTRASDEAGAAAAPAKQPSITELLREGQEILVQIAKEPVGQKGARITSHITLPGRYVVYMPTVDHLGVSRKITSRIERRRLRRILQTHRKGIPGGFIVRTAGAGRSEEEIAKDMLFLYNLWLEIRRKADEVRAPALIYHDLGVIERTLRDELDETFKAIWVDNEEAYEAILRFLERYQPDMIHRVKLYTRPTPIFDAFNLTPEIDNLLKSKVWLKSGGYIVINLTEAFVAIDVNTGKFVGKSDQLEDTIVSTNIEAAQEIARQLRLRDIGGIIVVDFIDMAERRNRQKVLQALEEAMAADRAPYKILQFHDFGLVAITRKRVRQGLERTLCIPCPVCESSGFIKSPETVVSDIFIEAQRLAEAIREEEDREIVLRVHPEVAKVLKSHRNRYLEQLEELLGRAVVVQSDPKIRPDQYALA